MAEINVISPSKGLVTRIPSDQAGRPKGDYYQQEMLRGLSIAQNVRCDQGVLRAAPGLEPVETPDDVVTSSINMIWQANILSNGTTITQPVIGDGNQLLAVVRITPVVKTLDASLVITPSDDEFGFTAPAPFSDTSLPSWNGSGNHFQMSQNVAFGPFDQTLTILYTFTAHGSFTLFFSNINLFWTDTTSGPTLEYGTASTWDLKVNGGSVLNRTLTRDSDNSGDISYTDDLPSVNLVDGDVVTLEAFLEVRQVGTERVGFITIGLNLNTFSII